MSNLPFTLPTCDVPAAARIEVYTPAPGAELGSLDASVYVCVDHLEDVGLAVWVAGFTPQIFTLAPDIKRVCGEVYVFPTGNLGGAK